VNVGIEIERKFLVKHDGWRAAALSRVEILQGYLANTAKSSIRLRIAGDAATLSVKGMTPGLSRDEFEYAIPAADARRMLATLCEGPLLGKVRYLVACGPHRYEVDDFEGPNAGLVVAELELASPDEAFDRPDWLGEEVTGHVRYYNFRLAAAPFGHWPDEDRQAARAGRHRESAVGEGS
jgi:adenylate cyclase